MSILQRSTALFFLLSQLMFGLSAHAQNEQAIPSELSETYGSWIVKCQTQLAAEGQQPVQQCEMVQEHFQSENGKRVLAISVRANENSATLTFLAPFGLQLAAGIEVTLSDQQLLKSDFNTCLPSGCISVTQLPLDKIESLTSESEVKVVMVTVDNQAIVTSIPFVGFSSALNRLQSF